MTIWRNAMTKWEDLPQWAKDKGQSIAESNQLSSDITSTATDIASALVEQDRIAEARGSKKAACIADPYASGAASFLAFSEIIRTLKD